MDGKAEGGIELCALFAASSSSELGLELFQQVLYGGVGVGGGRGQIQTFSHLNLVFSLVRKGGFHCPGSRRVFLSNPAGAGEPREEPERQHGV